MEIYTPIEQAGQIIRQRWQDQKLRKAVEEKLQGDIPEILKDGPVGLIWRCICTPDGEFKRFLELCEKAELRPTGFENSQDKFYGRNFTKYGLVNLSFFDRVENNQTIVEKEKIIDFIGAEHKRMCDLQTLWGENLVDFHHFFLPAVFPIMKNRTADLSEWMRRMRRKPESYYFYILSFAICHAVYFDDYDALDEEDEFVNKVILPAFCEVEKYFGVKPIIARISNPDEYRKDLYWACYPKEAKNIKNNHVKNFKC